MATQTRRRSWWRFSLRSLLVVMTLACLYAGWERYRYRHNREVGQLIRDVEAEGHMVYTAEFAFGHPLWYVTFWSRLLEYVAVTDVSEFYVHEQIGSKPDLVASVARRAVALEFRQVTDLDRAFLSRCFGSRLRFLDLKECRTTDDLLLDLPTCSNLESVDVTGSALSPQCLAAISAHPQLESIAFPAATQDLLNLPALRSNKVLRGFALERSYVQVGEEAEPLPPPALEPQHLQFLAACQELEYLDIGGPVTDATVRLIASHFQRLQVLHLQLSVLDDASIQSLLKLPELRTLNLHECELSAASRAAIDAFQKAHPTIR